MLTKYVSDLKKDDELKLGNDITIRLNKIGENVTKISIKLPEEIKIVKTSSSNRSNLLSKQRA